MYPIREVLRKFEPRRHYAALRYFVEIVVEFDATPPTVMTSGC
ncbi:MAG TPA: hypothetical protein VLW65_14635 [Bryobacteraceae bacterium]|nr:hypothetical protein [Bryobacteraceae bacterium]